MSSTAWCAPATSSLASAATGGCAAPLPSRTINPGRRLLANSTPSATFETKGSPAMPPPQRRHPTVTTPLRAASSK